MGLDIAWTRVWLGFDRDSQQSLLRSLLGPLLPWLGAVVLLAIAVALVGSLAVMRWLQGRSQGDAARRELERLLGLLARHGLVPEPGETLPRFVARVEQRLPQLAPELQGFAAQYQHQRFVPRGAGGSPAAALRRLRRQRRALGRRLRRLSGGVAAGKAG